MLDIDPAFEGHKLEKVHRHKAMKHGVCTLFNRQATHNLQMLNNEYEKKQKLHVCGPRLQTDRRDKVRARETKRDQSERQMGPADVCRTSQGS